MASVLQDLDILVLQLPIRQPALETLASIFRILRLQSLLESPESFTDKYKEVATRSDFSINPNQSHLKEGSSRSNLQAP